MKKCIFYLTLIFCAGLLFSKDYDLSACSDSSINFQFFQLKNIIDNNKKDNWCLTFSPGRKNYTPFTTSIGQIYAGGAISKLKSPALTSNPYALGSGVKPVSELEIIFPSASNLKKERPLALGCIFELPSWHNLQKFNLVSFTDTENHSFSSGLLQIKTGKKSSLAFSCTGGIFEISNKSDSWFSETSLFPERKNLALNLQSAWICPFYKTKEIINIFENEKHPNITFSSENTIKIYDFTLNLDFFYASNKVLYTAASTRLKTLSQIKINPQFNLYPFGNKTQIQYGLFFLAEEKLESNESTYINLKTSSQINCLTPALAGKLSISLSGPKLKDTITGKIYFSSKSFLKPAQSLTVTKDNTSEKITLKYTEKISLPGKKSFSSLSANIEAALKKKELNKLKTGIKSSFRLKKKALTAIFTAGLDINLIQI